MTNKGKVLFGNRKLKHGPSAELADPWKDLRSNPKISIIEVASDR